MKSIHIQWAWIIELFNVKVHILLPAMTQFTSLLIIEEKVILTSLSCIQQTNFKLLLSTLSPQVTIGTQIMRRISILSTMMKKISFIFNLRSMLAATLGMKTRITQSALFAWMLTRTLSWKMETLDLLLAISDEQDL